MGTLMQILGMFEEKEEDEGEDWTVQDQNAHTEEIDEETEEEKRKANPNVAIFGMMVGTASIIAASVLIAIIWLGVKFVAYLLN